MQEWIDVAQGATEEREITARDKCFIRGSKIVEVRFKEFENGKCCIELSEASGPCFQFIETTLDEGYRKFNLLAEQLGIPERLSDQQTSSALFRQKEEEKESDDPFIEIEKLRRQLREKE